MTSLTRMGLDLGPLSRTLFRFFLCVLTIPLFMLVAWGLVFSYQQELSPNVILLRLLCLYRDYCPKKGPVDTQNCRPQQGPADTTINRRYLIRYQVDVLTYAQSDWFSLLRILSYCYYY